ncbi:MAG: DUF2845 domain-containing protein [Xanthomonadales bacterium]|nr:DUF2845 domain-containing protein [Xanthomonadales bacterium]
MNSKYAICAAVLCSAIFFAASLQADSYRCGRKLIRSGDSAGEVLSRCGPPRYKDRGRASVRIAGGKEELAVQRWYYRKSSRSLGRVILIHQGQVVGIEIE